MTFPRRTHLGDRLGALADGELSQPARDGALSHIAHCLKCRAELATQRSVKSLLNTAPSPAPDDRLVAALRTLAEPGTPLPPRARTTPEGPVVPDLSAPGRGPRGARTDSRRPGGRRRARRAGVLTAGALSAAGLVLATAFVAGGSSAPGPVVPPVAELSVEHNRTTGGVTVGDPATGLMTTFDNPALQNPTTTSTRR
ncbi:MAG: hypothetical protein LH461_04610 [Spirochaetaceae bacterium]|nr:hypothetical protein [Spirochaetaceae bacterium]